MPSYLHVIRVVPTGGLGGDRWGITCKQALLELEQRYSKQQYTEPQK
ncbi:MGMT family protein [Chroococcidiopsis sp. SAG 2025]|nr:MGMT family protein [Chroococcidiopsis sp. SAG 2025]